MHGNVLHGKTATSLVSLISLALLGLSGAAARGQASPAPAPANSRAQVSRSSDSEFDIGVSGYEALNSATTANGVTQTPSNSPGGMVEFRRIQSPLVGYELTYGYNPADEVIGSTGCGQSCPIPAQHLTSGASLVGLDWILSKKFGNLRPFFAGGLGFFIDEPGRSTYGINDTVRIAWLYGGGVDFAISRHLGVRAQYRALTYHVPNLSMFFPAQGIYTTTSEPMGGVFYRF